MSRVLDWLATRPARNLLIILTFSAFVLLTIGSDEPTLAFAAGSGWTFAIVWLVEHA